MTHKNVKTGKNVTKIGASWKGKNNVEYTQVLTPLGFTSRAGNLANIQVMRTSNLESLTK